MSNKQIAEDYVSYEIAVLLKEKGIDFIDCVTYYCEDKPKEVNYSFCGETNSTWEKRCCQAPTHQMTFKWLREEKKVFIYVEPFITISHKGRNLKGYKPWLCTLDSEGSWVNPLNSYTPTYEQAVEAALKYTLENLI